MASQELQAEITRMQAEVEKDPSPANKFALRVLEARTSGLVVHVATPERGTPFWFEQAGMEAGKEVREPVQLQFVTAGKAVLPAHDGSLCILPGHAPMVGLLGSGELVVTSRKAELPSPRTPDRTIAVRDGEEFRFFVSNGTFRVKDNKVVILAARGFRPDRLAVDDLEDEERRREIQSRITQEGLEGEALQKVIVDAKKSEVAAKREALESRDPSLQKAEEMRAVRAMEKLLS